MSKNEIVLIAYSSLGSDIYIPKVIEEPNINAIAESLKKAMPYDRFLFGSSIL